MLTNRGRLFVYATYATGGAFALAIFLTIMSALSPGVVAVAPTLFASISGLVGAGFVALGAKATAEGWQQGKQPSSEVTSSIKTSGPVPPLIQPLEGG